MALRLWFRYLQGLFLGGVDGLQCGVACDQSCIRLARQTALLSWYQDLWFSDRKTLKVKSFSSDWGASMSNWATCNLEHHFGEKVSSLVFVPGVHGFHTCFVYNSSTKQEGSKDWSLWHTHIVAEGGWSLKHTWFCHGRMISSTSMKLDSYPKQYQRLSLGLLSYCWFWIPPEKNCWQYLLNGAVECV